MAKYYGVAKLHSFSFGLSLGLIWGISMLVLGWVGMETGLGVGFVETMRTIYIGYSATAKGFVWGGIWGFVHMFILGFIVAAIYNLSVSIFCRKYRDSDKSNPS